MTLNVCTLNDVTVTLIATGVCTLRGAQGGSSTFNPAAGVERSFTIQKASQSITFAPLLDQALSVTSLNVSATASSGLPVTFKALTPAVCTVAGNTVILVAEGACSIQALQEGNEFFTAAESVTQTFQVMTTLSEKHHFYLPVIER